MNSVSLIGRLTRDVEVKYANSGTSIARFTLAVDRRFKKDGDQSADFIPCVAFGKTAEFVEKYFNKGNKIALNGRIQTGSYENNDGQRVYTTEVIVENVEFVESKTASAVSTRENAEIPVPDISDFVDAGEDEEMPF